MALRVTRAQRVTDARVPLYGGEFRLIVYKDELERKEHLALVKGEVRGRESVLVRVHSECFTGDVIGSLRCDCGLQLQQSLRLMAAHPCGVLLYLRQEGRGIGLVEKLRAYNLQDQGYDTVDANLQLGHPADPREYSVAAQMLEDLGVASVQLLTNNPHKVRELQRLGVQVHARLPLVVPVSAESRRYLQTKVQRMEHLLELSAGAESLAEARPWITLAYAQGLDGRALPCESGPVDPGAVLWDSSMDLHALHSGGVGHVQVRGTAVGEFLARRQGDAVLVTVVPQVGGEGAPVFQPPRLVEPSWEPWGDSMLLRARIDWYNQP